MDCDRIREHLDAYTLDAADDHERAAIERHLATCADCRERARELAEATLALPQALAAASPLRPPAALKDRLLASVAAASPVADGATRTSGRHRAQSPPPASDDLTPRRGADRRPDRGWRAWGTSGTVARLAAVIVLLLALGWSVRLGVALERERALNAEFAALVGQQEIVFEVVDSNQTVRRVLLTTRPETCEPAVTCPYGKLFSRADLAHVVAMAARLPEPPAGLVYRLWLTTGDRSQPAGTMTLDGKGFGLLVFDAAAPGPVYDAAELILQEDDATGTTGDVVLRWTPAA